MTLQTSYLLVLLLYKTWALSVTFHCSYKLSHSPPSVMKLGIQTWQITCCVSLTPNLSPGRVSPLGLNVLLFHPSSGYVPIREKDSLFTHSLRPPQVTKPNPTPPALRRPHSCWAQPGPRFRVRATQYYTGNHSSKRKKSGPLAYSTLILLSKLFLKLQPAAY